VSAPPSISIVVTARHDNYGGPYAERILKPLEFNCARLLEHNVDYELILVEWDPVPGRPLLSEIVARHFPQLANSAIRRIVVAPEYQAALTQNPKAGYFEYIAKNVGIRRAKAPVVLVSNVDVLLGREVVQAIAGGRLAPATIHRAARVDIKLGIDQTGLTWEALEDPANHDRRPTLRPPLFSGGAGDFLLADRETFHTLRGFNEVYRAARSGIDLNFLVKAYGAGVRIADIGGPVYHINHVGSMRISKAMYAETSTDTPWGNLRWHSRHVVYNNPDGWGLADAVDAERLVERGGRSGWEAVGRGNHSPQHKAESDPGSKQPDQCKPLRRAIRITSRQHRSEQRHRRRMRLKRETPPPRRVVDPQRAFFRSCALGRPQRHSAPRTGWRGRDLELILVPC
jgi:hypothetical protein